MANEGASVVITHHVIKGRQHEFEEWLNEISAVCKSWTGIIDWQAIRPIPELTFGYTVILRFDSLENLKAWIDSDARKSLIKKVKPILAKNDSYYIKSGWDFLFTQENHPGKTPVKWKQYFVTWSAIYPLSVITPIIISPLLRQLNIPEHRYIDSFFFSGIIILLVVYLIMPNYTKLIKKWLYN